MRGVREERPSHLATFALASSPPMRRTSTAAACLALLALAGCARSWRGAAGTAAADPNARFFQLADGIFDRVTGPSGFTRRSPRPWTVQERIADLAFVGDTLWLAVNGHGLGLRRSRRSAVVRRAVR